MLRQSSKSFGGSGVVSHLNFCEIADQMLQKLEFVLRGARDDMQRGALVYEVLQLPPARSSGGWDTADC